MHKRFELEAKRRCWHERGTRCRFPGKEEEAASGSKDSRVERKERPEEEEAIASGSEAKSTPTRSTSPEAEDESQGPERGQEREEPETGNRERNEERTQESIEEGIRMIREARNYQIFIDIDQEKARMQICEIVLETEELGGCPEATRKRQRDGECADRYRREAINSDLITLQYVDDEIRDKRKGSEEEVKSRSEEGKDETRRAALAAAEHEQPLPRSPVQANGWMPVSMAHLPTNTEQINHPR